MKSTEKAPPHSAFNEAIWRWTLTMPVGKWYPIAPSKMTKEQFTDCIKYLICCGESLTFSEDYSAFKRDEPPSVDYISR